MTVIASCALPTINYQKLRLALAFIFTVRGIPDVYYGTEQNCYGRGDSHGVGRYRKQRKSQVMPSFSEDGITYKYIQRLTELRKTYSCLQTGVQREMWSEDNIYAYSRRDDTTGQEVIVIFNNGTSNETRQIPIRAESSLTIGTTLTNLLDTSVTAQITSRQRNGQNAQYYAACENGLCIYIRHGCRIHADGAHCHNDSRPL